MPNLVPFDVDLTVYEGARIAAVLDAIGSRWDPTEVYRGEAEAYRMLYSHLDATQQSIYDQLVDHGVLPATPGWSA